MPISTGDILGHSQVGVYLSVIGDVLFIPSILEDEIAEEVSNSFDLETHRISIGGSALLGSLIRGNKKGIAVADIATQDDLDELSQTAQPEVDTPASDEESNEDVSLEEVSESENQEPEVNSDEADGSNS